uniref:BTB domain-containing protein n=1 Tax=Panagrolaimus davidi TaxID=227884 RepID=A0A914QI67_9BILA
MAQKCQLCDERLEIFKSQDQENGYFDLKFEVEGKIIFAHKFMLASVSDVFKRMISDIWNKKETIEIETYSYKDFYDFLKFIYSGKCELNDNNIFVMVDLSEFNHIKSLQQSCDEYLSKKEFTKENTLVFFETLSNYLLPLFEKAILTAVKQKCPTFVESAEFMEASTETVKKIVSFQDRFVSEEKLFETVLKITNSVGNSICGYLQNNSAIEIIETLKNRESDNSYHDSIFWKTKCKQPSTSSPLKKRAGIEWYLVYFFNGDIGVGNSIEIYQYTYLLAEMTAETDFKVTPKCKIEIQ